MREERERLERAAMQMFVRALRVTTGRRLYLLEQRERPDFLVEDGWGRKIGVEITHLYHNEAEARYLNGREGENIHPLTSVEELVFALNRNLAKKAALSIGYDTFDALYLLIRVTSPDVPKSQVVLRLDEIVVPNSAFDEIWLLFYDWDHLDWNVLLQLR